VPARRGDSPIADPREVADESEPRSSPQPEVTSSSPDLVAIALRWLPGTLLTGLLVVVVRTVAAPLTNMDTYFHLRFGHEFLHGHWSLWHPGSVNTFATAHWLPTQWLPEVVMAQVEDWFGLAGVAWLSGLQQIGLICALYFMCRRWADARVVVLLLLPTLAAMSLGLSMRPQVLSYILVAVTIGAWLRTHEDGVLRWWLVPLTWLWAMLHGMWPIGIALGAVAVVGLALDRRADVRGLLRAAAVPAASAVAAALTPLGPALYGAVLGVGDRAHFFSEWNSTDFTAVPAAMVLGILLAICVVLFLRAPRRSWTDILYFLVAGGCAVWSYRTVPIAAVVLMPLIARAATSLQSRAHEMGHQAAQLAPEHVLRRPEVARVLGGCVAVLAVLAILVPHTSQSPTRQPAWVDPTLSALRPGTKVVSDWTYSAYLMWKYPQLDLLMNGYGDTFTLAEIQSQADIMSLDPGWDKELRATHCLIAVLDPTTRLAYALEHQEGWRVVHHSGALEMLVAPPAWAVSSGSASG
jgi:hypothetical protein